MQLHIDSFHLNLKPFKCYYCDKSFPHKGNLNDHLSTHGMGNDKSFSTDEIFHDFELQYNSIKIGEEARESTKYKFDRGENATNSASPYLCPVDHCDKKFSRRCNVQVHINSCHLKLKPFKCDYCDKTFARKESLKDHLSTHGMGRTYNCDLCEKVFNNRDSIILHKKKYHTGNKSHWCTECGKGFYKSQSLKKHQRSHTGEKPYRCERCNTTFSQLSTLKNHQQRATVCEDKLSSNDR